MPELAEVEYFRKQWGEPEGQVVEKVSFHPKARIFREVAAPKLRGLKGAHFTGSFRHGKQMLFQFGTDSWLGIHLGMTGNLRSESPAYTPEKHDHLVLKTDARSLVFEDPRMFGKVTLDRSAEFPDWWVALPPEVASKAFKLGLVEDFLSRRKGSPIKAVLLMQERFPGIGNWMADEILWRAGIHPARKAGELESNEVRAVWKETRWVARQALKTIGRDWSDPPRSWLFLHRWSDGGTCPKTGVPLVREQIGGRTTCWSPGCQG